MRFLRYDVLYSYVLLRLCYWAEYARRNEDELLEILIQSGTKEKAALFKKQTDELNKVKKRKAEVDLVLALGKPKEEVRIVDFPESGSTAYYRDENGVHYVPKRSIDDLII